MRKGERLDRCKRGHSLRDPENVRYNKRGAAVCKSCKKLADRAIKERVGTGERHNRRWLDDEIGLLLDPPEGFTLAQVAQVLGRTWGAVSSMKHRLDDGWIPKADSSLSDDEIDFIRRSGGMTAERVADELGRPYGTVTYWRRILGRDEGVDFGRGPYDKNAHWPGDRLVLAKTCVDCGVIYGGAEFHSSRGKLLSMCRRCRSGRIDTEAASAARELRVEQMSGGKYAERRYEPYTEADIEVLMDPSLTVTEKAARLGRTAGATQQALNRYGLTNKPESDRREPGGVWLIDIPA